MLRWRALTPVTGRFLCCGRARTSTSPPAAALPTTIAVTVGTQLRGSRIADSSQSASSSAAASVSSERPRSSLSESRSGGSTGTRAERSSCSTRSTSLIGLVLLVQPLLQLPYRSVNQHLGGSFGAAHRPRDLAVVHVEREAHDQCLAAIVGQFRHALQDLLHLLALLHHALRVERRGQDRGVVEVGLRLARAVAVVVRSEVVGNPDEPRPQRAAGRLALGALEM